MGRPQLIAAIVIAGVSTLVPAMTFAAPGGLDPTFGTGGKVVVSVGPYSERAYAVVLQPDGKIVVGGSLYDGSEMHFLIARFDQAGVLDPTFGSGGSVTTVVNGTSEAIAALLPQPDGRIVAVGQTYTTESDIALVRYESDGTLDTSFGTGGKVVSTLGPGRGSVYAGLLQPDGKIVVTGVAVDSTGTFALARFAPDGSVDTTFGASGEVLTDVGPFFDSSYAAALQPDGKILLAGTASGELGVVRYESDGTLDGTFGIGGIVTGDEPDYPRAIAIQPDGRIVVAGDHDDDVSAGSDFNFKLRRLNPDGSPDATFQGGSVVTTAVGPLDDLVLSVLLQPSGRIVLAGYTTTSTFLSAEFALVRYEADGNLDATFGNGGIVTTALAGFARDTAAAALLQPDSKIVAVGEHYFPPNGDFALARYFGNDCGDGTIEGGEPCDDGNTAGGDCCTSMCQYDAASTPCTDDANPCTTDRCDGAGTCLYESVICPFCEVCDTASGCVERPRSGCAAPGLNGRASLVLKDRAPFQGDVARWGWRSATVPSDFGDPTTADDYALCVYEGPDEALWLTSEAPAGDVCAGRPCWAALGQPPLTGGARYTDPTRTPDGISTLVLSTNPRTRIRLKAKGALLGLPALGSLDLPVRVQVQRAGEACWEATFDTPSVSTSERFEATVR